MRARDVFMDSLVANGALKIFGNPGTTENPLLESLTAYPNIEYIVALHEGVAVCAAGAYAQATGHTAVANVHVAPGLGNAIGMMYGCLKAQSPVVVTAGQQDTRLRLRRPLLSHNLTEMAAPVVKWTAEPRTADEMAPIMREAFQIANEYPKGPVFVSLPNNVMESETEIGAFPVIDIAKAQPDSAAIEALADRIRGAKNIALSLGDEVARAGASELVAQLAGLTGAAVHSEVLQARLGLGSAHPNWAGQLPMTTAGLRETLARYDLVLSIGAATMEELWYDPGLPLPASTHIVQIEHSEALVNREHGASSALCGDIATTLGLLIEALGDDTTLATNAAARTSELTARAAARETDRVSKREKLSGRTPMTPLEAMYALADSLPNDVVIVDEAITASGDLDQAFQKTDPLEYFGNRGGGIGQGIAGALGTAVGLPDKAVIAVSGDGSAMYSIQALWTAAHHQLNVLFVILANAEYRVLKHNIDIHRARFDAPSDQAYPHMDLTDPGLNFTEMASGMGVRATRAGSSEDIATAVSEYMVQDGPYLLEITVSGKS